MPLAIELGRAASSRLGPAPITLARSARGRAPRAGASLTGVKLISRFKDYYDSLRALDRDPDPVYVRETQTHALHSMAAARRFEADRLFSATTVMPRIYGVERGVLGFCGRLFPFYIVGPSVCYTHARLVVLFVGERRQARFDIV